MGHFEKHGHRIQTSNGEMTITKMTSNKSWDNTSYGKLWINSQIKQIATWTIKINHLHPWDELCFGFVSKDIRCNEDFRNMKDAPFYYISSKGWYMATDDIITFTLNTKKATISIQKQNERYVKDSKNVFKN